MAEENARAASDDRHNRSSQKMDSHRHHVQSGIQSLSYSTFDCAVVIRHRQILHIRGSIIVIVMKSQDWESGFAIAWLCVLGGGDILRDQGITVVPCSCLDIRHRTDAADFRPHIAAHLYLVTTSLF